MDHWLKWKTAKIGNTRFYSNRRLPLFSWLSRPEIDSFLILLLIRSSYSPGSSTFLTDLYKKLLQIVNLHSFVPELQLEIGWLFKYTGINTKPTRHNTYKTETSYRRGD